MPVFCLDAVPRWQRTWPFNAELLRHARQTTYMYLWPRLHRIWHTSLPHGGRRCDDLHAFHSTVCYFLLTAERCDLEAFVPSTSPRHVTASAWLGPTAYDQLALQIINSPLIINGSWIEFFPGDYFPGKEPSLANGVTWQLNISSAVYVISFQVANGMAWQWQLSYLRWQSTYRLPFNHYDRRAMRWS